MQITRNYFRNDLLEGAFTTATVHLYLLRKQVLREQTGRLTEPYPSTEPKPATPFVIIRLVSGADDAARNDPGGTDAGDPSSGHSGDATSGKDEFDDTDDEALDVDFDDTGAISGTTVGGTTGGGIATNAGMGAETSGNDTGGSTLAGQTEASDEDHIDAGTGTAQRGNQAGINDTAGTP